MTIFGLGNPTERYARTRHNVGFMVLDTIARRKRARFRYFRDRGVLCTEHAGVRLVLIKPLCYMNRSGVVVAAELARRPDNFLVVSDDLALPFGRLRLRAQGSAGGHKGLASIIQHLGRDDFWRLRFGIGSPGPETTATDYVLQPFTAEEAAQLPTLLKRAADACLMTATQGIQAAMNRFNRDANCTQELSV